MFSVLQRMSLPLFLKELLEQAARPRTYWIRIIYVALLVYFALGSLALELRSVNPLNVLGRGLPILVSLVNWQFWAIFLLLPGMTCGVLTTEKERNTLALLFLTRLGPWAIIMEKLLSRLFPMFMFLMCGLPVMAFTYSLGGLSPLQLFIGAYFLSLGLLLTGSVAVMCSALCISTLGAFIQTYVVLIALSCIHPALRYLVFHGVNNELGFALSPPTLFQEFVSRWPTTWIAPWIITIVCGIPSFLASFCCLGVARWALYRRAFVTPSSRLLKVFKGIDKVFFWANRKVAFDVKLVKESDSLPTDAPIAWREVSKRSPGQFRYLVRIMIPLMFPVLFAGTIIATSNASDYRGGAATGLTGMICFLWIVSLVLVMITAANTIPLERTRQSWDVLRSTPLTGREILTQKLCGVRRLQWVCSIPVFSAIGLQAWLRSQITDTDFLWWEYLVGAVGSVVIYSELVKWISMWCGLIFVNSMRAILMSALMIGAASILPQFLLAIAIYFFSDLVPTEFSALIMGVLCSMSPWYFTEWNEVGNLRKILSLPLAPALINLSTYCGLLWLLHRHLMRRAEWYLERIGVSGAVRSDSSNTIDSSTQQDFNSVLTQQLESPDSGTVSVATSDESAFTSQQIPS